MNYRKTHLITMLGTRSARMKIDIETPPELKADIYKHYSIDHDPCPLHGLENGPDGLDPAIPWGKNNFVNPPWDKEGIIAFTARAIKEMGNGNNTYMLIPFRTGTRYYDKVFGGCTGIDFLGDHVKFVGYPQPYVLPLAIFRFEAGQPLVYEFKKENTFRVWTKK